MENTTRPLGTTVALVVTVLYGLSIGVLAVVGAPDLGTIAVIGAMVVGAVWVLVTVLRRRSPNRTV